MISHSNSKYLVAICVGCDYTLKNYRLSSPFFIDEAADVAGTARLFYCPDVFEVVLVKVVDDATKRCFDCSHINLGQAVISVRQNLHRRARWTPAKYERHPKYRYSFHAGLLRNPPGE